MIKKQQIVIVGGGAGGLGLARRLGSRLKGKPFDVTLVDKNLTHIWKPLLHEVAAGTLDANMDEVGYGGHGNRWGYLFINGEIAAVNRDRKTITIAPKMEGDEEIIGEHEIAYDQLVLAIGGESNSYDIDGVRDQAMFLESRANADTFRLKLLNACMRVSHEAANGTRTRSVKIAIVGGGATGVELAAELYNAAGALRSYGLRGFERNWLEVTLLEAGPRILPALPDRIASSARTALESLGVTILTGQAVARVDKHVITTTDGTRLDTDMTLWAAGVKAPTGMRDLADFDFDRLDRIQVKDTLQTTVDDAIYVIGDCASFLPDGADRPLHPRAQAAQQMAGAVLTNIMRSIKGKPPKPFVYNDRGSLVSLGKRQALGNLMGNLIGHSMALEGRLARMAYKSLYRMHIISIHGWWRGIAMILLGRVNDVIRPKVKLH